MAAREWLTVEQAAVELDLSYSAIMGLVRRNEIPFFRATVRGRAKIPRAEFDAWLTKRIAASTDESGDAEVERALHSADDDDLEESADERRAARRA